MLTFNQLLFNKQFLVFPISTHVDITIFQYGKTILYFFYNIAQKILTKERWENDLELYQHGSWPISVKNLQMLHYKVHFNKSKLFIT